MRPAVLWVLLLSCAFAPNITHGQPIEVTDLARVDLSKRWLIWKDESAKASIEEVSSVEAANRFSAADGTTSLGFSNSAWWLKFTLTNSSDSPRPVMLRHDYPLIDYVDLFEPQVGGGWIRHSTGDRRAFDSREIEHREFVFPLSVPANSTQTYYVRFESDGPINIGLLLQTPNNLLGSLSRGQLAYGIYYGGFIVLVLYNFFIFVFVRDRTFFYYLLYAVCYGLYFAIHNGLTFQFMWPSSPDWANQSLLVMLSLTLIFGLHFSRVFLSMGAISPRLDRLAFGCQLTAAAALLASSFAAYSLVILPLAALSLVTVITILSMGFVALLSGYRPARYFMLAWSALLVGVMIYMLKTFGLLPHNVFTHNGFQLGSLIEMVLLSLALASRVNQLREESQTDALTGLANRRQFNERLDAEFDRATRYQQPLSLLIIDIDHFKRFNDDYGHAKGDEALALVANQLSDSARRHDLVCRYGGEEFAMILPSTDDESARLLGERLRASVREASIGDAHVTISVGVACQINAAFDAPGELFAAADDALYQSKGAGRDRVTVHETPAKPDLAEDAASVAG